MDLKQNNVTVSFIWTKGHCGVEGNEIADIAAKSSHSCHHMDKVFNLKDLNNALKPNIRRKWETDYKRIANKSTNHYFRIHPTLPKNIPHFTFNYNRTHMSVLTRLKLNHARFPSHLYKIGILNSPVCSRGETYTLHRAICAVDDSKPLKLREQEMRIKHLSK
uniref:Uncharacterized protein LOC114330893 n=1 Tax=Diabrotica virgifera virgifera TaxID=50390 RepID=A0A6P7FMN3_DIAVI